MATIMQLAERRATAQVRVNMLMQMNQPVGFEDQVKADAAYSLAMDALSRCDKEYRDALAAMATDDLIKLSQ